MSVLEVLYLKNYYNNYLFKYVSKFVYYCYGRDTPVVGRKVQKEAATINSKRPAASCCKFVVVELHCLPGQQKFFMNSFGVTFKIEYFLSLLQTGFLFLVVLTTRLCALIAFVSILQQKLTEAQKRLPCCLHFCSNLMTPKIIRRQSLHHFFCRVRSFSDQFKQQIHNCVCYRYWQQLHINNRELSEQLIQKQ